MTALAVNALNKAFGGLRVTRDVNLTVQPGERRLIIGPNGAGKTTLFNLITGEIEPDNGTIRLFDRDITRVPKFCTLRQVVTHFTEELDFLSPGDLEWIMGRGLVECLRWPASPSP